MTLCRHCHEHVCNAGRGLCRRCYSDLSIREQYKRLDWQRGSDKPRCRHCGIWAGLSNKRWLCGPCFRDRSIRDLYPLSLRAIKTRPVRTDPYHEPTEAELEVIIAEQMKCLPEWWKRGVSSV